MADTKISALTAATAAAFANELPINEAGVSKKISLTQVGTLLTPADFVASGGSHAHGLVPDPGASSGTTKYLREDASWQPIVPFVASGASHAQGLVPDPGSTADTAKFLREDATWVSLGKWAAFTPTITAGTGTWTITGGGVARWILVDKTITVNVVQYGNQSVAVTNSLALTIPGGYSAATVAYVVGRFYDAWMMTYLTGYALVTAASNVITIYRELSAATNIPVANGHSFTFTFTFEVV